MNKAIKITCDVLQGMGVEPSTMKPLSAIVLVAIVVIGLSILYLILSKLVEPIINRITQRTSIKWDDIIFRHKAIRWVWLLILGVIARSALPASLAVYPSISNGAYICVRIVLILIMMMCIIEFVKSVFLLFADSENIEKVAVQMRIAADNGEEFVYKPSHSLKGLQQMLVVLIVGGASILIISMLLGKDPLVIFSGLGAAAAVLMLIFQDSILGVVAGIQLTVNDMLQPGDWVVVPKYEANGIVQEVTLATVKVKNWDNTIVTIPPYKLISEGFQNWRGMIDSKGRRISRSILIDMSTVQKVDAEKAEIWRSTEWGKSLPKGDIVNLTAFRVYLEAFIKDVPTFVPNLLFMVRELQPTAQGLPVEIYFFTSDIEWKKYEKVQADVFDQIIAMVNDFGLRIYQAPSSANFERLSASK